MLSIIAAIVITLFLFLILSSNRILKFTGLSKQGIITLFSIKIIAGLMMWAIYSFYYTPRNTSDSFNYFDDASIMYSTLKIDPGIYIRMLTGIDDDDPVIQNYYDSMNLWVKPLEDNVYNDSRIVIRVNAFLMLFSQRSFLVHIIMFCFIGFIGQLYLFRSLNIAFPNSVSGNLISVFLLPSVLFWSSGILKEPILMLGFGYLVYFIFQFPDRLNSKKRGNILLALLAMILSMYLKFYILIVLIPAILAIIMMQKWRKKIVLIIGGSFSFLYLFALLISYLPLDFNVFEIVARKQNDFIKVAEVFQAGSAIEIPLLTSSPLSVLINSPIAFFNTLLRPFLWESKNILMLVAAFENLFFVILILFAAFNFKSEKFNSKYMAFMITFIIGLFVLIGLVTPIVGAMVRYKIPALPFLTAIMFVFIPRSILKGNFQKLTLHCEHFFLAPGSKN